MSTVSVVMGVKDGAAYVASAVRSVLRQTHEDLELLVMDDGSTDASADILEDLATTDPRLRVFHQTNQGLGASLNTLIAHSTATYIARLDADDICLPRRIEAQVAYLERQREVAMAGTWTAFHAGAGGIRACQVFPDRSRWLASQLTKGRNVFVHSSMMLRRSALTALPGPYRFRQVQDFDLWLRMAETSPVGMVQEVGVAARWHPSRVSGRGYLARRRLHDAILELHRDRERFGRERRAVQEIERWAFDAAQAAAPVDIGPDWYEAMLALYERDFANARRCFASVVADGGALAAKARRWTVVLGLPLARHWLPTVYPPLRYMVPARAVGDEAFWDQVESWLYEIGFESETAAGVERS